MELREEQGSRNLSGRLFQEHYLGFYWEIIHSLQNILLGTRQIKQKSPLEESQRG